MPATPGDDGPPAFCVFFESVPAGTDRFSYRIKQVIFIAVFIGIDFAHTTSPPIVSAAAKVVARRVNSRRSIRNAEGADGVISEATMRDAIRHHCLHPGQEFPGSILGPDKSSSFFFIAVTKPPDSPSLPYKFERG